MTAARTHAFETSHPAVPPSIWGATVLIACSPSSPVLVAVSLAGALAASLAFRGVRATLRGLRWQLPGHGRDLPRQPALLGIWVHGAVAPGFRGHLPREPCVRSLHGRDARGRGCSGSSAPRACSRRTACSSSVPRALPTVTLMVSMTAQLVPQLVRRGQDGQVDVCRPARPASGTKDVRHAQVRMSDVLVAWAMEDSLERADAMRARGWGSTEARTTYRSVEFRARDAGRAHGRRGVPACQRPPCVRRVLAVAFLSHHAPARGLVGIRTVCRPGASAHGARTHGEVKVGMIETDAPAISMRDLSFSYAVPRGSLPTRRCSTMLRLRFRAGRSPCSPGILARGRPRSCASPSPRWHLQACSGAPSRCSGGTCARSIPQSPRSSWGMSSRVPTTR